jgi:hypothetical protein
MKDLTEFDKLPGPYPTPSVPEVCEVLAAVWDYDPPNYQGEILARLGGPVDRLWHRDDEGVSAATVVAHWALEATLAMCGDFNPDDVGDWEWFDDYVVRLRQARQRPTAPRAARGWKLTYPIDVGDELADFDPGVERAFAILGLEHDPGGGWHTSWCVGICADGTVLLDAVNIEPVNAVLFLTYEDAVDFAARASIKPEQLFIVHVHLGAKVGRDS